jgi:predicted O-methyltransferase YrrM
MVDVAGVDMVSIVIHSRIMFSQLSNAAPSAAEGVGHMEKLARKARTALSVFSFWVKAGKHSSEQTPASLADLAFASPRVAPGQVRSELVQFGSIVAAQKPRTVLEIGTRGGGTFFVLCRLSSPEATVISLDLPGGKYGGGYPKYMAPILRRMGRPSQAIHLLRANSHNPETRVRVAHILAGRALDLLFIDGDHTYEGVKRDFEMYGSLVRPGGIIAFHDIVPHPPEADCAVDELWQEVRPMYRNHEIIENPCQGWAGIGVLFL